MAFSKEQVEQLTAKLDSRNVRTRKQEGLELSYIEGWHALAEANRIFGFDAWSRETLETRCVWEGSRRTFRGERPACSYVAKVRITVRAGWDGNGVPALVVREGTGAGHGFGLTLGEAHESAVKEAETDATKRALATFGNPFGLALYDREKRDVTTFEDEQVAAAQSAAVSGRSPARQPELAMDGGGRRDGEEGTQPSRAAAPRAGRTRGTAAREQDQAPAEAEASGAEAQGAPSSAQAEPGLIPVPMTPDGKRSDWRTWARQFAATVEQAPDGRWLERLVEENRVPLSNLNEDRPKWYAELERRIEARRERLLRLAAA